MERTEDTNKDSFRNVRLLAVILYRRKHSM